MLKGIPIKRQNAQDQEKNRLRLETDIAQLINENNSLKTQVTNLLAQLDYAHRSMKEKLEALEIKEKEIEKSIILANKEASDIIEKAYKNADIITQEVISSSFDTLIEIQKNVDHDKDLYNRLAFKSEALKHILSGIDQEEIKNLMLFNEDHDTFFKK